MIASRVLFSCAITGLVASGCLELVRRHPAPVEELDSGNPVQAQNVQGMEAAEQDVQGNPDPADPDSAPADPDSAPADPDSALNAPDSSAVELATSSGSTGAAEEEPDSTSASVLEIVAAEPDGEPQETAPGSRPDSTAEIHQAAGPVNAAEPTPVASKSARIVRPRGKQGSVKQINEYAFWCVEKGLWKEARTHLEHAIEQDSSAASLYNNIGIVYEHLGEEEMALEAYRRAYALNPKQRRYRENIKLIERRWRAVPDSLGRIDIFDMDGAGSPDSTAVATPAKPEPATDEGSGEGNPSMENGSGRAEG